MSDLGSIFGEVALSAKAVEVIAQRAAEIVLDQLGEPPAPSPYLTVGEAAEFLRCKPQRIRDLLSRRRLTTHRKAAGRWSLVRS